MIQITSLVILRLEVFKQEIKKGIADASWPISFSDSGGS